MSLITVHHPSRPEPMYVALCPIQSCGWTCSNHDPLIVKRRERDHWTEAHTWAEGETR